MIMEEEEYEFVSIQDQGASDNISRGTCIGNQMYMAPNVAQYDRENEYEPLYSQINILPASAKQSPSRQQEYQSNAEVTATDDLVKKKRPGCIAVCIVLTTFGVIVFVALAVGALGLRGSSNAQFVIARQSQDYTHLMEEISALKSVLSQLKYETNKNISRLSSSAYMAFSQLSTSVPILSIYRVHSSPVHSNQHMSV